MFRTPALLAVVVAFAIGICACGDDDPSSAPPPAPPTGTVEGTVTLVPDDSLLVGIELVLMDVGVMRVVAGPVATNAAGSFRLEEVPVGRYYPIPLYHQDLQFDRSSDAVEVLEDEVFQLELRAIRSQMWDAEGLTVSGRVQDARSGRSVAGALVTARGGVTRSFFEGVTLPSDAFTDAEGHFELRGVSEHCTHLGCTGESWSLMVTCPGYEAFSFRVAMPGPDEPDSVHVELVLEPGGGDSAILGRVVKDGAPAAGVPVMLDWAQQGELLEKTERKAPLMGFASVTDAEGWYRFEGVPAGELYTVAPGYLPDDGYFFWIHQQVHAQFELAEGVRHTVAELELGTVVEPIFPLPGAVVEVEDPVFRWTEVPGADSYRVSFAAGYLFDGGTTVEEPQIQFPTPIPDGVFIRWNVRAFQEDRIIGGFEQIHTFQVRLTQPD